MLSKIEKRLCVLAVVFVVIYLGAAVLTLHSRSDEKEETQLKFESVAPAEAEGRLAMVELFPPMLVLLAIAISYVIVKKKRARQIVALEKSEYQTLPPVQEPAAGVEEKILVLKRQLGNGLITQEEYDKKKAALLENL